MKNIDLAPLRRAAEQIGPLMKKYRAVLIVLLTGVLLLSSGGWFRGAKEEKTPAAGAAPAGGTAFDLSAFERELAGKIGAIDGVGRVELMLSLEETEEAVYAVDVRQTQNGDSSKSYESGLTVVSDGSYGEKPVTVKSLQPTFRGAVVLCDGAGDASVRYAVTKAVSTVCGLGSDKVTVLKMAQGT